MKDNIIIRLDKNGFVYLEKTELGINYENIVRNIIFEFNENEFVNGVAWLEIEMPDLTKGYVELDKENETYTLPIKSSLLTQVGKIKLQLRITKAKVEEEIPIFKSNIFYLVVKDAINSTETIPSEYPSWIDIINQKLEVSNIIAGENITLEKNEMDIVINAKDTIYDDTEIREEINTINGQIDEISLEVASVENELENKVDKEVNKGLSTNDYTNEEKSKLASLNNYDDTQIRELINNLESGIPTKTSQLQNDSNFINQVKTINNKSIIGTGNIEIKGGAEYDDTEIKQEISNLDIEVGRLNTNINNIASDVSKKAGKDEIPDVSEFIKINVDNLVNYYLKSETYNKSEINELIGAIKTISMRILPEKPATGEANIIYLIPSSKAETGNIYDEYIYINNAWELIGTTKINLSDYYTKDEINTLLFDYITSNDLELILDSYALKTEIPDVSNFLTQEQLNNQKYDYVKDGLVNNTNQLTDEEQIKIETWLGLAHNYLTYYNETPYTVTSDYVPAHKKYVDSKIGDIDTLLQDLNTGRGVE